MSIPPDEAHDVTQDEALVDAVADYISALIRLGGGKLDTKLPPLPDMDLTTFLAITEHLMTRLGQLHAPFRKQSPSEDPGGTPPEPEDEKSSPASDADEQSSKNKKRFAYPQTESYEEGIEPPPISLAGVALDAPIFSKGKSGKGPFEVTVRPVEVAKGSEAAESEAQAGTVEARKEGA